MREPGSGQNLPRTRAERRQRLKAIVERVERGARIVVEELARELGVKKSTVHEDLASLPPGLVEKRGRGRGGGWFRFSGQALPMDETERRERLRQLVKPRAPGEPLGVGRLAEELGASEATVRRDLEQLPDGLVENLGRGRSGWVRAGGTPPLSPAPRRQRLAKLVEPVAPGEPLGVGRLAEELGVSIRTLREDLKQLPPNLVENRGPGRGGGRVRAGGIRPLSPAERRQRLCELVEPVAAGESVQVSELARCLRTSKHTVHRDLRTLPTSLVVDGGPGVGYLRAGGPGPQARRLERLRELVTDAGPGDRLPTRDLAATFGVSEDTVRKGLRLLPASLVERRPGRGYFRAGGETPQAIRRARLRELVEAASPGQRLVLAKLARCLGVRRATVREDLRALPASLVEIRGPGRGAGWFRAGGTPPLTPAARRQRLAKLVEPVAPGEPVPVKELAAELGVSVRTIRDDLRALPASLVETRGPGRGGWVRAGGSPPLTPLERRQRLAKLVEVVAPGEPVPVKELGRDLVVSVPTIRDDLRALPASLVERRPGRGYFRAGGETPQAIRRARLRELVEAASPGARLVATVLAGQLGVRRATVREELRTLPASLVEHSPGLGYYRAGGLTPRAKRLERLRELIEPIPPGMPLRVAKLAENLGVPEATVREDLKKLLGQLVEHRGHYGGWFRVSDQLLPQDHHGSPAEHGEQIQELVLDAEQIQELVLEILQVPRGESLSVRRLASRLGVPEDAVRGQLERLPEDLVENLGPGVGYFRATGALLTPDRRRERLQELIEELAPGEILDLTALARHLGVRVGTVREMLWELPAKLIEGPGPGETWRRRGSRESGGGSRLSRHRQAGR